MCQINIFLLLNGKYRMGISIWELPLVSRTPISQIYVPLKWIRFADSSFECILRQSVVASCCRTFSFLIPFILPFCNCNWRFARRIYVLIKGGMKVNYSLGKYVRQRCLSKLSSSKSCAHSVCVQFGRAAGKLQIQQNLSHSYPIHFEWLPPE